MMKSKIGLEQIGGLELSSNSINLSIDEIKKIGLMIPNKKIILMKNQKLEQSDLIRLIEAMGSTNIRKGGFFYSDNKEIGITRVTNERDINGHKMGIFADSELCWHCNGILRDNIQEVTLALYCVKSGDNRYGITSFCNAKQAYQDLPVNIKNLVDSIDVKVSFRTFVGEEQAQHKVEGHYRLEPSDPEYKVFSGQMKNANGGTSFRSEMEPLYKPLVCTHPWDKGRSLYFVPNFIQSWRHRKNLDFDSKKLWGYLMSHLFQSKYIYQHKWEPGDLLLSDQWYTLHKRSEIIGDRLLWRVSFDNSALLLEQ